MTEIQASLVFDSWQDAIPDLRRNSVDERHLIYEGGGVFFDLLLEPAEDGACLQIAGQVMPSDDLSQSVSHVPVLLEHRHTCERTHTNALGEFRFHYTPSDGCFDITIILGSRKFLVRGLGSDEPRKWQIMSSAVSQGTGKGGAQ